MRDNFLVVAAVTALICIIGMVGMASATEFQSFDTVQENGPLGVLISLGFEYVFANNVGWAMFCYSLVSVGILFFIGFFASKRTAAYFMIFEVLTAGMLIYFGWMQTPNMVTTWGILILAAMLAVMLYLREEQHLNWGLAGPGDIVPNYVTYIMVIECVAYIVRVISLGFTITPVGTGSGQYFGATLAGSFSSVAGVGGSNSSVLDLAMNFISAAFGFVMMIIQLIWALVWMPDTAMAIFPVLQGVPFVYWILCIFQVVFLVLVIFFLYKLWNKSVFVEV